MREAASDLGYAATIIDAPLARASGLLLVLAPACGGLREHDLSRPTI
jgi:hypothetical protein